MEEHRNKTEQELQKDLAETRQKLAELNIAKSVGRLQDYSQVKKTKRRIARILTVLKEKGNK